MDYKYHAVLMYHNLFCHMIDDELGLLGYAPEDVATIDDVDQCLRALGYNDYDIVSGNCLVQLPEKVMQVDEFKEKVALLSAKKHEYEMKSRLYADEMQKLQREVDKFNCAAPVQQLLPKIQQYKQGLEAIQRDLVLLHQQVNHFHLNVKVIPNNNSFTQCRDKLMQKRMELVLCQMESIYTTL